MVFYPQNLFRMLTVYNLEINTLRKDSHMSVSISISTPSKTYQMGSTNCSFDMEASNPEQLHLHHPLPTPPLKGKKRIGRYSFYLKHLIGSGFSSKVYRGIRDNQKGTSYAIKVIKLKDMSVASIHLLNNQIDIHQQLHHPHIVRFEDVLYTANHCYLITEYCEGGNLEKYYKNNETVEWGTITYQIAEGCQYLAGLNIIHRDLKPANIFLKEGKWKIGDFGFSKRIPHPSTLIIEGYKVGTPLFMPLQTLQRNMYSAKSDSFALGVIIFLLIFRETPWNGNNLAQLTHNHKNTQIDWQRFQPLPLQVSSIVRGLCNVSIKQRIQLSNCDFSIFKSQKSIKEIDDGLISMERRVTEQVVLCQFVNYLIRNSMLFLEADHPLYSLMSSHLHHLTHVFSWDDKRCLREMKQQYILPEGALRISQWHYRRLIHSLESVINLLKFRSDSNIHQVALQKLLEYYCICNLILQAQTEQLSDFLKTVTLHKNYHDLSPNRVRIDFLMGKLFQK